MEKNKTEVVAVLDENSEVIENERIVQFSRPYSFEGKEYEEIDLTGLDNLTASDMIAAQKVLERSGSFSVMPEMSLEYACIIAASATSQPVEFFKGLSPKDAIKIKNRVTGFFYGAD
ncbi:phage tail assembly protein [Lachnotalea glycerini]|uniref:Phage tail assembly protein n=1 Tax=Lachnotalea glycerini TaxID=1763509 RepID=A0A371JC06_9FIRM|nr:phage tail assembly protein [Lachnotalea glycerini]RDY30289.1 phage tail assembly protein [Lachnotalea glycerini]